MADSINPSGKSKGLGINFLPNFYKTDANKRFLQATVDQLIQPGTVKKVNGFIGRQYAKATNGNDIFVEASDAVRQQYQLEPGFVIEDTLGNNTFFKDYIDYINQLNVFGGNTTNHARLNKQEFYSWNPHIDWDKFVNFQNYYWLSYGPDTIKIYGQQRNSASTFNVKIFPELSNNQYVFTPDGATPNPVIKLYRGQTYTFIVDSAGNPFSIKTARTLEPADTYTSGVTNNNVTQGILTFTVPVNSPSILYYQSGTDLNLGGVFEVFSIDEDSYIDIETDILGKTTYTLSDGTQLSNGMKVSFGGNVSPAEYASGEYYVEGVGVAIKLINKLILEVSSSYNSSDSLKFDSTPFDSDAFGDSTGYASTLDYIVINRASTDHNPWSRYNRWFHKDVIESSAKYNKTSANLDQALRAVRPIIEFEANLKLFNFGTRATADIDLVDTFTTDAFSIVEGSLGYNVDSISLSQGQKILFLADTDRLVKNNLYQVEFIDVIHTVTAGISSRQIRLVKIAEPQINDVVLVKSGVNSQGLMYWYNGTTWLPAQQKTDTNQPPLFDIVNEDGISYGDKDVYDGSTFAGTKLFSYKVGTGTADSNVGFSLSYRNIENIGDIVFNFNLVTDSFQYKDVINVIDKYIKTGYLVTADYAGNTIYTNGWTVGLAEHTQAAVRIYKNSNKTNNFDIDFFDDKSDLADLVLRVYVNGKRLARDHWNVVDTPAYKQIVLTTSIKLTDVLTIRSFAAQPVNSKAFYEIPINLKNNPLNNDISDFTLGEVIDHVDSIIDNIYMEDADTIEENDFDFGGPTFIGVFPGASNLRDLGNVTGYGTKFVQHSGPASLSTYHITSETNNIVRAIEQSRDVYNQFKKNFISIAESLGIDAKPADQVNLILQELNKDKPNSFPYYFSDMVPYRASTISELTVIDPRIKSYPLKTIFNLDLLSFSAVGVYLTHGAVTTQLIYNKDYTFDNQGFVIISATLAEADTITIYEYETTDGSFIPETPTKLGLWPKYEPMIYLDTSLITPQWMIQGHDGSQVKAYGKYSAGDVGDYRDAVILELEKRIFNNIKVEYDPTIFDITTIVPGYNRKTEFSYTEFNEVLATNFYKWSSAVSTDFSKPIKFDRDNSFTYNYSAHVAPDGRFVPGYWRGVYQWILDTDRPQLTPWEMLGFSIEPAWWQDVYGPAPYTSDNKVMWQDIADGLVKEPGVPTVKLTRYEKPFLMNHLPVDEFGNLLSPSYSGIASGVSTSVITDSFVFGDMSPVEAAWRRSSHYSFSVILTAMILAPSSTFGVLLDRSRIIRNKTGQLVYKDTSLRIRPADVILTTTTSSAGRVQTAGIINYIINYILSDNLKSYDSYAYDLSNIASKLSYRVGAFTSKEKFNLLLDSKTPHSAGSVFVPPENYTTILNKSSPIKKITYSGVIITRLDDGYEVKGYSKTQPYFKSYPYIKSGVTINVGGISESYISWIPNQIYGAGKVVKYNNKYYRVTTTHTSTEIFNATAFSALGSLPVVGGRDATIRVLWDRTVSTIVPYGTKFYQIQDVVDFLLGYGEWLKDQGFVFDDFNNNLQAVTNWETSAKEFLFWTTQNWSAGQDSWTQWSETQDYNFGTIVKYKGEFYKAIRKLEASTIFDLEDYIKLDGLSTVGSSVISLSPAADKITFTTDQSVVDDIRNPFNGYEIFKVDGTPLEAMFINSYREDNAVSYSPRTSEGLYGASFYLIQHEHVIILDNATMFNDVIYNPESGYKQDRIKASGYVSNDWYGGLDIPGFIIDIAKIQNWVAWQDYDLGDIVKYKQFYYTASKFLAGTELFDSAVWIKLTKKPVTQMLPNWSYKVSQFEDFYSLDSDNFDSGQQKMAQHLIGYQKRQYLENIIQDDVSEFKFYQGMIIEKGTQNSLNKLFDVLSAEGEESLSFYEEWALRVGQYGASSAFENIEFILDESKFRNNPQGFELTNVSELTANFIIRQNSNDIYLKPDSYNNKPWPVLENYHPYLRSSGYVRPSEVFLSLKTIDDLVGKDIDTFTNGCYIWVAFKATDWDVYRYSTTSINVTNVTYTKSTKTLLLETEDLVKLKVGSYVGLGRVDILKGFYKIVDVNLNSFSVNADLPTWVPPFTQSSDVVVFSFVSQRTSSIDNIDAILTSQLVPNEQLWTDDNGTGKWSAWTYSPVYSGQSINNSVPADGLNFGRVIATDRKGSILVISDATGSIETWDKAGYSSPWIQRQTIPRPFISNNNTTLNKDVSANIAISPDGAWLATGSPLASNAFTKFRGVYGDITNYQVGDIVSIGNYQTPVFYEALEDSVYNNELTPDPMEWKQIQYVPVSLEGSSSNVINQGVISLYKKDSNNIYSLVDTIVSPLVQPGQLFGSSLVFGKDTLYVSAEGYGFVPAGPGNIPPAVPGTGRVYKLNYSTVIYATTYYNPVGSSNTTLAVTSTVGILPGMVLSGNGFTSSQIVIEILSSTKLIISSAPDSTPTSTIYFSLTGWGFDFSKEYIGTVSGSKYGNTITASEDNTTLVISATGGDINGVVTVIHNPGPDETYQTFAGTNLKYGQSIAVCGDSTYLAIADSLASGEKLYQGSVTIYKKVNGQFVYDPVNGHGQILENHLPEESGYFGSKIAFMNDYKTLVVYSAYEDTTTTTTFDTYTENLYPDAEDSLKYINDPASATNTTSTTFDNESTGYITNNVDSGRIDVYDMYATKWVYSEALSVPTASGEGYGIGFAVGVDHILVSAPYAIDTGLVSGKVFDYAKSPSTYSWTIKHTEIDKPDVNKVKKAFLYNRVTGKLVKYLDVVDVAQGRIPGPAAEEIKYNSFYDPATYSVGTSSVNIDESAPWTKQQVGRLWWDLRTAKFLNGYDSDVVYRNSVWNTLATGSTIDIYEWVETTLLPEAWDKITDTEAGVAAGISGTSLYGNTAYSIRQRFDSVSQTFKNTYYFWVKNKKTVPNVSGRHITAQDVANLISNPRGQGYTYLSLTGLDSFSLVNAKQYLKDTDIVLSVEYWTIDKTDQNIHSQWKIINNDLGTILPAPIELKWFDSLCGKDLAGREVPDLLLPLKLRYGIENRPRQGMFINRFEALKQLIEQANLILAKNQIVSTRDISKLSLYDTFPNTVTGLYDSTQDTDAELRFVNIGAFKRPIFDTPTIVDGRITKVNISYAGRGYLQAPYLTISGTGVGAKIKAIINTVGQVIGATIISSGEGYTDNTTIGIRDYSTLIYSDSQAQNNWSIYSYDPVGKEWSRVKSLTYDVRNYWSYADWYSAGYTQFTAINYAIDTLAELQSMTVEIGQVVKVRNDLTNWTLIEKYADSDSFDYTQSYKVVGIGQGTIQLSSTLYESIGTNTGYDSSTYDGVVFDNAPSLELRIILSSLKDDIFIDDLKLHYLELFFTTTRYALSEQVYLDWIFKTSFIKARHNVGVLDQPTTYRSDNLSNFQDYIAEVKPYKTKIREYVSSYKSIDTGNLLTTDFDLPPVYRQGAITTIEATAKYGTLKVYDANINEYPWKSWADNVGFTITELKIISGGSGYITEPVVRITSDSGSGATARAFFSNGVVNRIVLLTPGSGYLSAPTVTIDGGILTTGKSARVVAIIGRSVVRSNLIKIKFDRLTQTYVVTSLQETEIITPTGSKLQYALTWAPDIKIGTATVLVGGAPALRDSYKLSIVKSTTKGYTTYSGLITFTSIPKGEISITYLKDISLLNAADRIRYFYKPQDGDLGNDLSQLMTGIDYGGVIVNGLGFEISSGWGALPFFSDKWDSFDGTFEDYIVTVSADTHTFPPQDAPALPSSWKSGDNINVYHIKYNVDSHISDGSKLQYSYQVYDDNPRVSVKRVVPAGGVATNYNPSGSTGITLKVADTAGILAGMSVIGTGFASFQKVLTVVNSTTLTLTSAPNTQPNGTLTFTKSIPGSFTLSLDSTEGVEVGDAVRISAVSAFGYDTVVERILNSTEIVLNQIIYETIEPGFDIEFSRNLIIPTDVNIYTGGTITLTSPVTAGSIVIITGSLPLGRLDDPDFGTPAQTNPYAIMATPVITPSTTSISIPTEYPIYENDQIILRKTTSDGSFKTSDADYDTALTGGDMAYSSATGLAAEDIIIDGDGFVTPTSSPAPEEVVPGQVVDAVAIKIFDQPPSGSANIKVDTYLGDDTTTDFLITQQPSSSTAMIVNVNGVIQTLGTDYTIDYRNRLVNFNIAPTEKSIVSISSLGFNGSNILDIDYFVSDGNTVEFITRAPWIDTVTSLVYVDGVISSPDLFKTDYTYDSANRIGLKFGAPPEEGALISFVIVSGGEQTFAITTTQRILADSRENTNPETNLPNGTSTYNLAYRVDGVDRFIPVGDSLPNETNMIVRVDNEILQGPITSYFVIKNNKLNYTVDSTKILPYSTPISDVSVFVGSTQLSLGSDYTIDPGGLTIKINKITYAVYAKQTLVVSINTNQGYSYNPVSGQITFAGVYDSSRVIEVISSYKHDILDTQRTDTTISSTLSIEPNTLEFYNYKGLTAGIFALDRPVRDSSYVWVIKNNHLLTVGVDYKLNDDRQSIQLAREPEIDDQFSILTFGENVLVSGIAYMQFKDMLNRVHFKRLSLNKRTRLVTPLTSNSTTITVEDASNFDVPNPTINKPGIIEIRGERIEYYSINGNILGKLRRGTLGTGTPERHLAGTFVQEIGPGETIPYTETPIIEKIISDGTNIIPLSFAPTQSSEDWTSQYATDFVSSIPLGYGQSDEIEVFVGGYSTTTWVAATDTTPGVAYKIDDIVEVGVYTYRCISAHTSSSSFHADLSYWTFFVGNIRLKKAPYKVHNENTAPYSSEGDIQLDAEFATNGIDNHIRLTNKLSFGTQVTVIRRTGTDWDSKTNIQYSDDKIAKFLKATPGIWYAENQLSNTQGPVPLEPSSFDSTSTKFDGTNITFDQG
jgi:hypothetical protein